MILDSGKTHIKKYLAGQVGVISDTMAFGVMETTETSADTRLAFEVARAEVSVVSYDFVNDRLVFKGRLPLEFSGIIHEVGLWSQEINTAAAEYNSKLLLSFDSDSELWSFPVWNTTNARIGTDALRHAPAASGTATSDLTGVDFDLSGNSAADVFTLAYNVGNANTANIKVRFMTDASNYYEFTISTPTSGYKVTSVSKGSVAVTGTPTWDNITSVRVSTTATAGGAAQVDFDGLRIEDTDTNNPDYLLVARKVLAAPYTKVEGEEADMEFSIPVTL